jgi:hypothetical protein
MGRKTRRGGLGMAACATLVACGSSVGSGSNAATAQPSPWTGFNRITAFGSGCTASLAADPAAAIGPLTFIPCTSGEAQCEELRWDGAVHWDPGGGGDLLVFEVQFVHDDTGQATRALVRHHYPIGSGYDPNPYEAVLYDLSSGAPLAVFRNNGTQAGGPTIGSPEDCFVVPVASPHGLWLVGAQDLSAPGMLAAYLDGPGAASPTFQPVQVDSTFLNNAALAFDDRIALSQDDGKIVVADTSGHGKGIYGPGERVWLSSTIGDRFLTLNDQASDGDHYFTLDRSMAFAPYGGSDPLATDGVHIAYWKASSNGIEAWTADAADGVANATKLANVPSPSSATELLTYFGSALDRGTYSLLTIVDDELMSGTGPVTATVVSVDGGTAVTEQVLANAGTDPLSTGYRQVIGFAGGYLWLAEVGDIGGVSKIIRVKAPAP